jgi:hypothetical protein
VGCADSGLPSTVEDAALMVAKSDNTPDEGPATALVGGRRRRRRCADTGNRWRYCLGSISGQEARSRTLLAIKVTFLPRPGLAANGTGKAVQ